jgi:hypothetical protein
MKLQHLSIIFVIIILPISLVLSAYIQAQTTALNEQTEYDGRLIASTYDAIKAYQLNTLNNSTSNVANSKIRDIEASANTFFNSLSSSFGMSGYSASTLKSYVPALVYTMYDGYYIYTPFNNRNDLGIDDDGENIYGLKPYVYYSCRYRKDDNNDIVITYALDNYIAIQGIINGEYVNDGGYLLDDVGIYKASSQYYYSNILCNFGTTDNPLHETLYQSVPDKNGTLTSYPYRKINGTSYYLDEDNEEVFYFFNGARATQASKATSEETYNEYRDKILNNDSAFLYYKEAYEFTKKVRDTYGLDKWVSSKYACDESGNKIELSDNSEALIFKEKYNGISIEYADSAFNVHRKAVIRYTIETNLSTAISAYTSAQGSDYDFQMPKLQEDEWDLLMENVSLISFFQGIYSAGSIYNGYAIVTNNATDEVVQEKDIYMVVKNKSDSSTEYHKIIDKDFQILTGNEYSEVYGVLALDCKRRSVSINGSTYYFYPEGASACYSCVVNQTDVVSMDNKDIYEYLKSNYSGNSIRLLWVLNWDYYQALGRERYSAYKVRYMQLDENGHPAY